MIPFEPTLQKIYGRAEVLKHEWSSKKPFRYLIVDDFLANDFADAILASYPEPDIAGWDKTTYIHQRNKFTRTSDFPEPIERFFALTASNEFRDLITGITGISDLMYDPKLLGGGLHQILRGGFLDVHVDFNLHPATKLYRRLNLLLYLNKDWNSEWRGCLELWDMASGHQIEKIAPIFNRAVLFETNEISYHGHPHPLDVPQHITRKSLAIYYYTREASFMGIAPEHNTIYKQTTGVRGYLKTIISSAEAAAERARQNGAKALGEAIIKQLYRRMCGLPPENK